MMCDGIHTWRFIDIPSEIVEKGQNMDLHYHEALDSILERGYFILTIV